MELKSSFVDAVLHTIIRINFTKRSHFITINELKQQKHNEFVASMNCDDIEKCVEEIIFSKGGFLEVRRVNGVLKDFAIFCHHAKDI